MSTFEDLRALTHKQVVEYETYFATTIAEYESVEEFLTDQNSCRGDILTRYTTAHSDTPVKVSTRCRKTTRVRVKPGETKRCRHTFFEVCTVVCWPFHQGGFKALLNDIEKRIPADWHIYIDSVHSADLVLCLPRYGFVEDPLDPLSMILWRP